MSSDNGNVTQERMDEIGKRLGEGAEVARTSIAKRIAEAASTIRTEIDDNKDLDKDARVRATNIVDGLDSAAKYLETNTLDDIEDDAREVISDNPWQAIITALVIGLIVGWLLKGND